MKKMILNIWISLLLVVSNHLNAQQLQRRPFLGVALVAVTDSIAKVYQLKDSRGAYVANVFRNSTADKLQLQQGDIILKVNDNPITSHQQVVALARNFKTGEPVQVEVMRNKKLAFLSGNVMQMPFESHATSEVIYDEVKTPSGISRPILKRPKGKGKYPAIFYIQGFGCYSMDNLPERDPQRRLIDDLATKGYVVYRVEKPGVGDSKSLKPCAEIGYNEEAETFLAALKALKNYSFVDTNKIVLFGHSLGGNTAPLIAAKEKVKGIIAYGSTGKPWVEYLIDLFRTQRPVTGTSYLQVDEDMRTLLPLVYEYMVLKKTPDELVKNEKYKPFFEQNFGYDGGRHVMGRHYTFLQELQDIPLTKAWVDAAAHTLAIYGEADAQALDAEGAQIIADIVNAYHPGKAKAIVLSKTDHGFIEVCTKKEYRRLQETGQYDAFAAEHFSTKLVSIIDDWCKDIFKS